MTTYTTSSSNNLLNEPDASGLRNVNKANVFQKYLRQAVIIRSLMISPIILFDKVPVAWQAERAKPQSPLKTLAISFFGVSVPHIRQI